MTELKKRKVRITNGEWRDVIIVTDAPQERILELCKQFYEKQTEEDNDEFDCTDELLDVLRVTYYVNYIVDTLDMSDDSELLKVVGWEEHYYVNINAHINNTDSMIGFIYQHGKDDYSVWIVDIDQEDQDKIHSVLNKYDCYGYSVRGDKESVLADFE